MDLNDISTQLMYTTVPVFAQCKDGRISTGTGFIFSIDQGNNSSIPLLITNYHVVENALNGYVEMHVVRDGVPSKEVAKVQFDEDVILPNKLGDLDLVALPLAGAINDLQGKGNLLFFKSINQDLIPTEAIVNDLASVEDVTFIGYPSSIYDVVNKTPVIRRGISATPIWNHFQGQEQFLIDASVFPGSSGSPVFIYNRGSYPTKDGIAIGNRVIFVGILTQTIRRKENNTIDYLNLGIVINSRAFFRELDRYIIKMTGTGIRRTQKA